MHIAQPKRRDDLNRAPIEVKVSSNMTESVTAKQMQEEMGGAGVFFIPSQMHFKLDNPDWNFDKVPEFMDGMNVADFNDPELNAKLDQLEREEEE
jgi:nucleolar GTP-binding protein